MRAGAVNEAEILTRQSVAPEFPAPRGATPSDNPRNRRATRFTHIPQGYHVRMKHASHRSQLLRLKREKLDELFDVLSRFGK